MRYYIIIPAHNEAAYIALTLQSLAGQSVLPEKVVVVNDNSTDDTEAIVNDFSRKYPWISVIEKKNRMRFIYPEAKSSRHFKKDWKLLTTIMTFL